MSYSINIYGRADSKSPDIIYTFAIGEHLHDGKWFHTVIEKKYEFKNELIEELSEDPACRTVIFAPQTHSGQVLQIKWLRKMTGL